MSEGWWGVCAGFIGCVVAGCWSVSLEWWGRQDDCGGEGGDGGGGELVKYLLSCVCLSASIR